jgi:hypothetical protein
MSMFWEPPILGTVPPVRVKSERRINDEEPCVLCALISSWSFRCKISDVWLASGSSANVVLTSYYATSKLLSFRTFAKDLPAAFC